MQFIFGCFFCRGEKDAKKAPRVNFSDRNYIDSDIIDIYHDRCWGKISRKYLKLVTPDSIGIIPLIKALSNSDDFSCNEGVIFRSEEDYSVTEVLDTSAHDVSLMSLVTEESEKVAGCTKKTKCGIMLKRSLVKKGNSMGHFLLEIVQDTVDEDNHEIHYHNVYGSFKTVSMLMGIRSTAGKEFITPIPFNCVPCKDSNGIWNWGFYLFSGYAKHSGKTPCYYNFGRDVKARMIFFVILV